MAYCGGLQVVESREDTLQTQQSDWKVFQKKNVVNFVAKSSIAAFVGLFSVGAAGGVNGNLQAHTVAGCSADEGKYTILKGDTWENVATRFSTTGEQLKAQNPGVGFDMNQTICVPNGGKTLTVNGSDRETLEVPTHTATRVAKNEIQIRAVAIKKVPVVPATPTPVPTQPAATTTPTVQQTPTAQQTPVASVVAPQTAVSSAVGTYNAYPFPACTYWADERYHQLHGVYVPWTSNANAYQWTTRAAEYGWRVSASPTVGSILVLQPGVQGANTAYGHVAIVEQVLSNGHVVASSLSWNGAPTVVTNWEFAPGPGVAFVSR